MYLNCHSNFSLKRGTLSVKKLVQLAAEKGITQLALTDVNNTSAGFDFLNACKNQKIQGVVGIEFRDDDGQLLYVGLPKNQDGFQELSNLLTKKLKDKIDLPKTPPKLNKAFFVIPMSHNLDPSKLAPNHFIGITHYWAKHNFLHSVWKTPQKLVAFHPIFFARNKAHYELHQVLRAIDQNELLSKLKPTDVEPHHHSFCSPDELKKLFGERDFLLHNATWLLDQCSSNYYPEEVKNKASYKGTKSKDVALLKALTLEGFKSRYPKNDKAAKERVDKELKVIAELNFQAYFLITCDIVNEAKRRGFHHVGRGSGANSIVAYCLGITDVDPIELDLYFERFINPHRSSPPDFDIDFSWDQRDEIIEYVFEKFGKNNKVGLIATYSTFKGKSILREVGKVYGLPKAEIDMLINYPEKKEFQNNITAKIFQLGRLMENFPNHLSIHAGGIIISQTPLTRYTALEMMPKGFPITHWDMHVAEDIGYYKYDILSQRGLGHIKESVDIIKENKGVEIDIHQVTNFKTDEGVKAQLRSGHCIGCFYVESPAMRGLLKKLRCDNYLSLVAASSIIRPGVAQSGMMREYIFRFHNPNNFNYIHPVMEKLLQETFGVMVYQEDVIKVAHHFAGIDLADADILRRGMSGKSRSKNEMLRITDTFFNNCNERGYPETISKEVWRQIESFSGYSFSKAHSASFAVESFQSLYLKTYFPKEFMVAVLNNFGGFYRTEFYVHEARMNGANILAPCVHHSNHLTRIIGDDIYLGFVHVKELEKKSIRAILKERQERPFDDLDDFISRTKIHLEQLIILIKIGALRFTGIGKKQLLWEAHLLLGNKNKIAESLELFKVKSQKFELPTLTHTKLDDALDELELLGFPLCSPFELLKEEVKEDITADDLLPNLGKIVTMVGYVVTVKPTHTKKRELMNFGCFLDRQGKFFDTVHFPPQLKKFPFRGSGCYKVKGKVVEEFGFPSLEVNYMEKLPFYSKDDL
jgi:DNA-directed DNA polymerase III PolC